MGSWAVGLGRSNRNPQPTGHLERRALYRGRAYPPQQRPSASGKRQGRSWRTVSLLGRHTRPSRTRALGRRSLLPLHFVGQTHDTFGSTGLVGHGQEPAPGARPRPVQGKQLCPPMSKTPASTEDSAGTEAPPPRPDHGVGRRLLPGLCPGHAGPRARPQRHREKLPPGAVPGSRSGSAQESHSPHSNTCVGREPTLVCSREHTDEVGRYSPSLDRIPG